MYGMQQFKVWNASSTQSGMPSVKRLACRQYKVWHANSLESGMQHYTIPDATVLCMDTVLDATVYSLIRPSDCKGATITFSIKKSNRYTTTDLNTCIIA
jgi:hypothetical protein